MPTDPDLAPETHNSEQDDEAEQAQTLAEAALGRAPGDYGSPTESIKVNGNNHDEDSTQTWSITCATWNAPAGSTWAPIAAKTTWTTTRTNTARRTGSTTPSRRRRSSLRPSRLGGQRQGAFQPRFDGQSWDGCG